MLLLGMTETGTFEFAGEGGANAFFTKRVSGSD